jgi:hypothetical protein
MKCTHAHRANLSKETRGIQFAVECPSMQTFAGNSRDAQLALFYIKDLREQMDDAEGSQQIVSVSVSLLDSSWCHVLAIQGPSERPRHHHMHGVKMTTRTQQHSCNGANI